MQPESYPERPATDRPPLGVMPRTIWLEKRMTELIEAIDRTHQQIQRGTYPGFADDHYRRMGEWCSELCEIGKMHGQLVKTAP